MFRQLGRNVVRFWPFLLVAWVLTAVALTMAAPRWTDVIQQGEFAFLPEDMASRQGEELFKQSFPSDLLASSVVIVVRRESDPNGLQDRDREFITDILQPGLEKIAEEEGIAATNTVESEDDDESENLTRVRTFADQRIGKLLDSQDNKATLVLVELTTEFLDWRNSTLVKRVEELIDRNGDLAESTPPGLALAVSGSATVGRDMIKAANDSSQATELWTVLLVIMLLIVIYRAPIIAMIPLVTVAIATRIALTTLAQLAKWDIVGLFNGIEVYVTILCYGAGVDYCLFLIARYKEELDEGASIEEAIENALAKVGAALTASAGTVMCGIGMLVFAEFKKFQQAGVGITFGLFVVLCAALTFTPCLLRLTGRWAFWPRVPTDRLSTSAGWLSTTSLIGRLLERDLIQNAWTRIGEKLLKKPGRILATSGLLMLPFAVVGCSFNDYLSYGLLSELPRDNPSVVGAKAVQTHFPAGVAGPVTILLKNADVDFADDSIILDSITDRLIDKQGELQLADVRNRTHPLGLHASTDDEEESGDSKQNFFSMARNRVRNQKVREYYVSQAEGLEGQVARIDVIFQDDPFSRNSIAQLERLQKTVDATLTGQMLGMHFDDSDECRIESIIEETPATDSGLRPGDRIIEVEGQSVDRHDDLRAMIGESSSDTINIVAERELSEGPRARIEVDLPLVEGWREFSTTEMAALGPTPSIRDLKIVTDRDQIRVNILVLAGVFLILVVLLRKPAISLYLIASVFFSYLATLGVTFALFWFLDGSEFSGLDWKVPMFLFTILIAVGEDYNIFLMTRIEEEQERHGLVQGVVVALQKTGSIISSCGIIMAGTFSSLLAGTLVGLHQLGFALAFGVLLDTFVVRPILVPAYLILLYEGRLGALGKILGANRLAERQVASSVEAHGDS